MHRRKFIQTICVVSTISTGFITGCKSTKPLFQGRVEENKLFVLLTAFDEINTLSVAFEKQAIGVTKLDNNKYVAVLLTCTHKGCAITHNKREGEDINFICPCHGAQFSAVGKVLKGPAQENLIQYVTSTDNEHVIIHL